MRVQWIDYGESESIARDFLDVNHRARTIPVPIELIVERLELHIVPVNGLRTLIRSQEGVLLKKTREILVDYQQWQSGDARYLFTLAHELGHFVLHSDFYEATKFKSIDEYKEWYLKQDPKAIDSLEIQANNFAGQVLLPDTKLVEEWDRMHETYGAMLEGFSEELVWSYVARPIAVKFGVSEPCALHRVKLARQSGLIDRLT